MRAQSADESKAKGKRGGYRVIYYFITDENEVWLITIYDKLNKKIFLRRMARVAKLFADQRETENRGEWKMNLKKYLRRFKNAEGIFYRPCAISLHSI